VCPLFVSSLPEVSAVTEAGLKASMVSAQGQIQKRQLKRPTLEPYDFFTLVTALGPDSGEEGG
jgi:hypothetical protein